jgi:hypothetical protein
MHADDKLCCTKALCAAQLVTRMHELANCCASESAFMAHHWRHIASLAFRIRM